VINSPAVGLAASPEEYTRAALRLIDSGVELKERGALSREYAEENYSQETYAKRVRALYGDVVRDFKPAPNANLVLSELQKESVKTSGSGEKDLEKSRTYRGFWREIFDVRRNAQLVFRGGARETFNLFLQILHSVFRA
jgi:hypothetical protein